MENASKALLIAAAVLIAIVIIAVGVVLVKNASNTTKQADEVGNLLKESTKIASGDARGAMKGIIISKNKFNDFLEKFSTEHPNSYQNAGRGLKAILEEIETKNLKLKNQIELVGYIYKNQRTDKKLNKVIEGLKEIENQTVNEKFEKNLNFSIQNGDQISNPKDIELMRSMLWNKYLKEKMGEDYSKENYEKSGIKMPTSWFFHFDDTGYIDKICYLAYIHPDYSDKIGD